MHEVVLVGPSFSLSLCSDNHHIQEVKRFHRVAKGARILRAATAGSSRHPCSMEQLVESHALKLMSNDACEFISEGTCLMDKASIVGALADEISAGAINVRYARFLQELLAYKRGGLVQRIFTLLLRLSNQQGVTPTTAAEDRNLLFGACRALALLTESRLVAQFCVKEEGAARKLGESLLCVLSLQDLFTACIPFSPSRPGRDDDPSNVLMNFFLYRALSCLRILANVSRASRPFRRSLQQLDALFPSLEHLLSGEFVRYFHVREVSKLGTSVSGVLNTLLAFEDTQEWALDQGLIRIHWALGRMFSSLFEGGTILGTLDPAVLKLILSNLPEDPGTECAEELLSKMMLIGDGLAEQQEKQAAISNGERTFLEYDRDIRDPRNPQKTALRAAVVEGCNRTLLATMRQEQESLGISFPVHLVEALNAGPTNPNYKKMQRSLAAWISGSFHAPAVCSWEHCGAGSELEAGRPFSKCAGCHLALYCR
jgi:hypothetical protein